MPISVILALLAVLAIILHFILHRKGCGDGKRLSDIFCRVWRRAF